MVLGIRPNTKFVYSLREPSGSLFLCPFFKIHIKNESKILEGRRKIKYGLDSKKFTEELIMKKEIVVRPLSYVNAREIQFQKDQVIAFGQA